MSVWAFNANAGHITTRKIIYCDVSRVFLFNCFVFHSPTSLTSFFSSKAAATRRKWPLTFRSRQRRRPSYSPSRNRMPPRDTARTTARPGALRSSTVHHRPTASRQLDWRGKSNSAHRSRQGPPDGGRRTGGCSPSSLAGGRAPSQRGGRLGLGPRDGDRRPDERALRSNVSWRFVESREHFQRALHDDPLAGKGGRFVTVAERRRRKWKRIRVDDAGKGRTHGRLEELENKKQLYQSNRPIKQSVNQIMITLKGRYIKLLY